VADVGDDREEAVDVVGSEEGVEGDPTGVTRTNQC